MVASPLTGVPRPKGSIPLHLPAGVLKMKNGALNSKSILIISLIAVTTLFTSCGGGSGSGPGGGGGTPQVSISVNPPSANLAINASQDMRIISVVLIALVQLVQSAGDYLARRVNRRLRHH